MLTQEDLNNINTILVDQLNMISKLADKEIPISSYEHDTLPYLCHKLIKLRVKELAIKKRIYNIIRKKTEDHWE